MNDNAFDQYLLKMTKVLDSKLILPIEHQLWDEKDISKYLKYTVDYTRKNIIPCPNFPPSRQLPTSKDSDRTSPRWKATDVIKYAMAFDKSNLKYNGN
ncbi:hypothetical protein [Acinetobacter guillouiae]|jgi:hypothetical protein|uniref:hypothetical protein n=1 Tax=Acinetobacter guillouiae TaxID=106649 RepID=UPI00124FEFA2|nr:hypothetical protein [Acinetobacter guillouiae]